MVKTFQFRESLSDMSLSEMFASIDRHKVPGLFEIRRDGVCKRIFITGGNIIHAASNDRTDRLGPYLYRIGDLSRKDLVETMRQREKSGKKYGQLLIEKGVLAPGELYTAIRSHMEAIVWSVFTWQKGEVSFRIGEFNEPQMVRIHLPMRQAIVRGIKKVPDTKALVARLGKKVTVFKPSHTTEDLIEIALNREEFDLLRLVDGRRSLFDICTLGPYSVSENASLLYAYRILRLIERVEDAEVADSQDASGQTSNDRSAPPQTSDDVAASPSGPTGR